MRSGRARHGLGVLLVLALSLLSSAAAAGAATGPAPVLFESFEAGAAPPPGWRLVEYVPNRSTASIVSGPAADGSHFLRISSPAQNHARLVLPVTLAAGTTYRFSALARATGLGNGAGAVLGLYSEFTVTPSVRTDDHWQPLELYVQTASAITVQLTLGLGHFGQPNTGTADFDAVTVAPVTAVPAGAVVTRVGGSTAANPQSQRVADLPALPGPSPVLWAFVAVLVAVVAISVVVLRRNQPQHERQP